MPRGIQVEAYQRILLYPKTKANIQRLQETFAGKKLVVAVDQLKERSGIQHKLMAYHRFLQKAPAELVAECVLVQITSAETEALGDDELTSGESNEDQQLLQQVYQMVGEVNSKFGRIGHLPVHFLCQEFGPEELASLFAKADVMIDTSLRDVIPNSAYNFLCCQVEDDCGVLILSEFSGSAPSLRAAALCVNPWDTNAFADAIQEALDMDKYDRLELYRYGCNHVHEYTLKDWATKFLEELQMAQQECENERLQIPPLLDHDKTVAAFATASRRIIIFGFGGTLIPHRMNYFAKFLPKITNTLQANLQVLTDDPNTEVIVLSALSRDTLAGTLAKVPCWMVAEGGVCYRKPGCEVWQSSVEQRDTEEWMIPVKEIMGYFADRTPGTSVVEMESSLCWSYQDTLGDHAAIQSKDLLIHLWAGPLLSAPAEVAVEKDCVSVKPSGASKAQALDKLLREIWGEPDLNIGTPHDAFVLCLGDFLMRDEDVFVNCKNFFEPEAALSKDPLTELEEEVNLEVNSRSLNSGYDLLHEQRREDFMGHLASLGLHAQHSDTSFCDDMALLRMTSHPDLTTVAAANQCREMSPEREKPDRAGLTASPSSEALRNVRSPCLFTCTVRRKATRAAYHVTDTHDVAFLVAKLAREVKQAKQSDFG
jgi:trehalose 6-phosphate synthase/phosphatase